MSKSQGFKKVRPTVELAGSAANDPDSLAQRRVERAVKQMPGALCARYAEIRDLLRVSVGATSWARYRAGAITLAVMNDPSKYGQHAVALLATAIGRNEDTLYSWARVAEAWPGEEFEKLAGRLTVHGVPLSISQLIAITGAKSADERARLVEETLAHGLSTKAIRRLVERGPSATPSPADDEDASTGRRLLTRMSATAATALKRVSRLAASLEAVPEDELDDPQFITLLETGIETHRELAKGMSETVRALEARLRSLRRISPRR